MDEEPTPLPLPLLIANGTIELRSLLGSGGMASVYLALDLQVRRMRAVKVLHSKYARDPQWRGRMELEAQSMAVLEDHPNVGRVYTQGTDGTYYYIVMELIDGANVQDIMFDNGYQPLPLPKIALIMNGLCSALGEAHRNKIVHRDIKPQNIMLPKNGKGVKVMDFGIAQSGSGNRSFTKTGMVAGTPDYWSPEQARDTKKVDYRTDIYSSGVVLFFLLTGTADTEQLFRMTEGDSRSRLLPPVWLPLICKATNLRPELRWQSMEEFATAFNQIYDQFVAGKLSPNEILPEMSGEQRGENMTYVHQAVSVDATNPLTVEVQAWPVLDPVPEEVAEEVKLVPEQEAVSEEMVDEVPETEPETSDFKPRHWLLGAVVIGLLLSIGGGVVMLWPDEQSEARPSLPSEVPEVTQTIAPEVKVEVKPEVVQPSPTVSVPEPKPAVAEVITPVVDKPKPMVVTPRVEAQAKPEVKVEAQPTIDLKPRIVAPAYSGKIAEGSLSFTAGLSPSNSAATATLIYRVGDDPKWQRRSMPPGSDGRYGVTVDVDQAASRVQYVIEIDQEGQLPLRSGSSTQPHVVKP